MYFEEFKVGKKYYTEPIVITKEEIKEFANKYDPLLLHIDEDYANNSMFKGIIASGFHTFSAVWGQWLKQNITGKEVLAGLGIDNLNWLSPVYPGDALTGEFEVAGLRPTSKGGSGVLTTKITIYNQHNKPVLTAQVKQLMKNKNK